MTLDTIFHGSPGQVSRDLEGEAAINGKGVMTGAGLRAGLRQEARLLLACAHTRLEARREAEIRGLVSGLLDWDYLERIAACHGLRPLLYQNLGMVCPEAVPRPLLETQKRGLRSNAIFAMLQSVELIALLKLFEEEGVEAIPYKGPLLGQAAYGDAALREFSDLDILVRPQDVRRAAAALLRRGYEPAVDLARLPIGLALRCGQELAFTRPKGATVDLHWCLTPMTLPALLDFDAARARLQPANLPGGAVRTLGPNDLLLSLLFPALRHQWSSLKWACDFSQVAAGGEVQWSEVAEQATARGYGRVLKVCVLVCRALFDAPTPAELLEAAQADERARNAAERIVQGAFAESNADEEVWALRCAQAGLLERARDKARYWAGLFLLPAYPEWAAIRLPRWLFLLYIPLRPLRLAARYAPQVAKRWGKLTSEYLR